MKSKFPRMVGLIIALVFIGFIGHHLYLNHLESTTLTTTRQPASDQWQRSSESKPYPNVISHPHMWILVSKKRQRVYLIDHGKVLYTMFASTGHGKDNDTPTGTYHIQKERGDHFYNAKSGEGANYWVSWKNHGEYLFHSVPVDRNNHYVISEAHTLGRESSSHGCVRLSIPDARWMYRNIKYGTKVVITNH